MTHGTCTYHNLHTQTDRGTFDADQADEELPTLTLVGLLKAKLTIPIIAAGGLMTGEDVWKATAAGAVGSSLGTAFLACEESGASAAHKRWLMDPVDRTTRLTRAFSGRRARGFVNAMVTALELPTATIAPFPFQNALTGGTRKASKDADDPEYQGLWAGTGFAKTRAMPASELMAVFAAEFKAAEGAHMVKQERMRNGYC
jgi:nitronate monooxygenase